MKTAPTLFASQHHQPLADRLRPLKLSDVIGQRQLLGDGAPLAQMMASGQFTSMILWGPPGCGKTTLARLIAAASGYHWETVSAVASGVAELKKIFEAARQRLGMGQRTLLFVDEIHRFNRAQQDAFLPVVEDGTILLVGATTENPSFELNAALLSRCRVLVLERLGEEDLNALIARAEQHYGKALPLVPEALPSLLAMADGDARYLLNLCEQLYGAGLKKPASREDLARILQKRAPVYDKHQDSHYNLISALHKALRGSDVDAALYWFQRMVQGGEDLLYIARRLVRFAVEDVGMADPQALIQANAAKEAYDFLGSPEGDLAIAQAVIYLAMAPKSNAQYMAFKQSARSAREQGSLMPPMHILNAPTKLMDELGYGEGYRYDHDEEDGFSGQNYFPDGMARQAYYQPYERGFEREMKKRLDYWHKLRSKKAGQE